MDPELTPQSAHAMPLDAEGRVTIDAPCARCGYNLRGLMCDGRCPECAAPVEHSLCGDELIHASPEWIDTLARGAAFSAYSWTLRFVVCCTALMTTAIGHFVVFLSILLLVDFILAYGVWLFTVDPPDRSTITAEWNLNRLARALAAGVCAIVIATIALSQFPMVILVGSLSETTLCALLLACVLLHAMRIARRIPSERRARHAKLLFQANAFVGVLVLVSGVRQLLVTRYGRTGSPDLTAGAICAQVLTYLLTLSFFDGFKRELKSISAAVRKAWKGT